jgi:hypothetical protein
MLYSPNDHPALRAPPPEEGNTPPKIPLPRRGGRRSLTGRSKNRLHPSWRYPFFRLAGTTCFRRLGGAEYRLTAERGTVVPGGKGEHPFGRVFSLGLSARFAVLSNVAGYGEVGVECRTGNGRAGREGITPFWKGVIPGLSARFAVWLMCRVDGFDPGSRSRAITGGFLYTNAAKKYSYRTVKVTFVELLLLSYSTKPMLP